MGGASSNKVAECSKRSQGRVDSAAASGHAMHPCLCMRICHPEAQLPQGDEGPAARILYIAVTAAICVTHGSACHLILCSAVPCPIGVVDFSYVASQPWPFPRSLMVGFYAAAAAEAQGTAGGDSSSSSSSSGVGLVESLSHQGRMAMMDSGIK
jgi:hypothetical protein